jgi:hypothetical protein
MAELLDQPREEIPNGGGERQLRALTPSHSVETFRSAKKEKEPKRKKLRKGRFMETAAAMEIEQGCFATFS